LSANVPRKKKKLQVNTIVESQLQLGKQWLEQLLGLMSLDTTVSTEGFEKVSTDSNSVWLNIDTSSLTVEQKAELIGNKGEGIDSIQYLANTILNLSTDSELQNSFVVELDGYRVKRHQELAALTQQAVDKVRQTGEEAEISGLSSAERKQIHSLLENVEGLTTESRGQEPDRRLIVRLQS
jgi:spoIIIJ-associated protein